VYSNGEYDPWRGGGVQKSLSPSLNAVYIAKGAHHLDLRAPNPADPISVIEAREFEEAQILRWITEAAKRNGNY
jgi:hypothetical protein